MNELQRLLGLVERWQHGPGAGVVNGPTMDDYQRFIADFMRFDLAALRTQLQQHAENIRVYAPGTKTQFFTLTAAADFLAP